MATNPALLNPQSIASVHGWANGMGAKATDRWVVYESGHIWHPETFRVSTEQKSFRMTFAEREPVYGTVDGLERVDYLGVPE